MYLLMGNVGEQNLDALLSLNRIRGTNYKAPHGMPLDLLDRLLIVSAEPYTMEEINLILKTRYWHFLCFACLWIEYVHQECN